MMEVLRQIKDKIKFTQKKNLWRKKNPDNFTQISRICEINRIEVGKKTYGELIVHCSGTEGKLRIGSFCSIADDVIFLLSSNHPTQTISTYPFKVKVCHQKKEALSKGDIIVDDDVWIGYGAKILSGVHIGQGAVIAAGAVVTKDVPPYAIVGGVPDKIIKFRFSEEIINYLLTLDYQKLDDSLIVEHMNEMYSSIEGMTLESVKEYFTWFPKK